MAFRNTVIVMALLFAAMTFTASAQSRSVVGASSATVFGAIPEEVVNKARADAVVRFGEELQIWLRENMRIDTDTANTVKRYAIKKLAARCLEGAEEKTVTRGRVWTLSLNVSDEGVRRALRAHNDYYDGQASAFFASASGNENPNLALPDAIGALANVMVKLEPVNTADGNAAAIRVFAQGLFDRMQVKVRETVIEGRPGALPQRSPTAMFMIDSLPLTDFHMTAFVQNGRELARVATDNRGELPIKNYKIPFVHNGSMLTIVPDVRPYLKTEQFIRFRDLGIRFSRGQELSFIFKLPVLTYTLEYAAFTKSPDIKIPADFSADAHVRKYLKEFCGLEPAPRGAAADLSIKIGVEISPHVYSDTEEESIKMTMRGEVRGSGIQKVHQETFEKRQRFGLSFQMGSYFWEASGAIRQLIANTLSKD